MKQITVCHVSTLTRWGGVESRLVEFLAHSSDRRLRHVVIATSAIGEIVQRVQEIGVPILIPKRRFHYDPRALWEMAMWMRSQHVDIVHTRNWVGNCWGGIAARLARVSVRIGGEHGTVFVKEWPWSWLESWVYRTSDMVIANSEATKTMVVLKRGVRAERIRVVYNGINEPEFLRREEARRRLKVHGFPFVVGTIGRLDTPKDFFTFLAAAREVLVRRQDVGFVIIGGGPLERELQEFARLLGLEAGRHVFFTGWLPDAGRLIRAFDVYVSTSIYESLGNSLIEAGFAGVPVVAPEVGGIPEIVLAGETGCLLPPVRPVYRPRSPDATPLPRQVVVRGRLEEPASLDPKELARVILKLLDQPQLRKRYGEAARRRMRELFTIDRYVGQIESVYIEMYQKKLGSRVAGA